MMMPWIMYMDMTMLYSGVYKFEPLLEKKTSQNEHADITGIIILVKKFGQNMDDGDREEIGASKDQCQFVIAIVYTRNIKRNQASPKCHEK